MNQWEREPNKEAFEHAGLKCFIKRHPSMKHLCGYVLIPKEHPLYEHTSIWDFPYDVHGGVTWVNKLDEDLEGKYIGFDCAHLHDLIPGASDGFRSHESIYRDFEYVGAETKSLAEQIAAGITVASK